MIIYKTTNLISKKIYVGQDSKNNPDYLGSGKYFRLAVKKYGKENFKKEIICYCSNKNELDEKEKYWIKELNCKAPNGYNIKDGGEGFLHGDLNPAKRPDVIEKLRRPKSDEAKKNMKIAHNRDEVKKKKSKPRSEEARKNIKNAQNRPEVLEKQRKPRGPLSEETRKNMKDAQNRPEVLEKRRGIHGPRSEKAKKNMKDAQNRPEVLYKHRKPRGPMSEENKIKLRKPRGPYKKRSKDEFINLTEKGQVLTI